MLIDEGSDAFREIFAGVDLWGQFQSLLPSHQVIVQALSDPSIDPYAEMSVVNLNRLNYQGVADLQSGTRRMLQKIILPGEAQGTFGFLKSSTQAIQNVMKFESIPASLNEAGVFRVLGVTNKGTPGQAAKGVAYAAGMSALSAMGPVGAAAAAIIGFAVMLANAFKSAKAKAEEREEARLRAAYQTFPPLQEPGADVDTFIVNNHLLPTLQSGDWTPIFMPRFLGDKWTGVPRIGGFALAMGSFTGGTNALGHPESVFIPTGGIGYWPGENRVTSILQVKVDPESTAVRNFMRSGARPNNAFRQASVQDVGDFLVNTTRMAAIAWEWVSSLDGSPHLYKVSVQELHDAWSRYCRSGVMAITSHEDRRDLFGFYKGAIACAVGSWQCWFDEGRYKHIGGKIHGWEMGRPPPKTWHPNRAHDQGCVIGPADAAAGNPLCLGNRYDLRTKLILQKLEARQEWFLRHSLSCAYVRRSWAAFRGNTGLRELLDRMRMLLLDHPDRRYVSLEDVPPGEMLPNGLELRAELERRGVGQRPLGLALASSPGALEPPAGGTPTVEPSGSMPFDLNHLVLPPPPAPWWRSGWALGALGVGVGGGLWLWNRR